MNLHIEIDNKEVPIYQTPSFITKMCLMDDRGIVRSSVTSASAMRAIYMYLEWLEFGRIKFWGSQVEFKVFREEMKEHRDAILKRIKNYSKVTVYLM